MDTLIKAMKDRIEEGSNKPGGESIGKILDEFISMGYSEDEVNKAFVIVSQMYDNGEYD